MGAMHAPKIAVKELDSIAAEENLGGLSERETERHRAALEGAETGTHLVCTPFIFSSLSFNGF
jgi:hypothetical protein